MPGPEYLCEKCQKRKKKKVGYMHRGVSWYSGRCIAGVFAQSDHPLTACVGTVTWVHMVPLIGQSTNVSQISAILLHKRRLLKMVAVVRPLSFPQQWLAFMSTRLLNRTLNPSVPTPLPNVDEPPWPRSTMLNSRKSTASSSSYSKSLFPFLSRSWFHAKVCIVAGVGFFTDAYVTP
jgi:hypothetical protein